MIDMVGIGPFITIPFILAHIGWTAAVVCIVTMLLLNRHIGAIGKLSVLLWIGVLGTVSIVIIAGLPHLKLDAILFWRAPRLDGGHGYDGLGKALIFAAYD